MQAFVLASPYYMQVAIDTALPALDHNLLDGPRDRLRPVHPDQRRRVAAALLRAADRRSLARASASPPTSPGGCSGFRSPGSRSGTWAISCPGSSRSSPIQQAMTQGAVAALIDGALAILTLAVMLFYSVKLTAIALVAFGLYALVRAVSFSLQRDAQEATIVTAAKEQSTLIESVRGIVTLRLFNREAARHALWQTRLTDSVNASVGLARINIWQQSTNTLIFGLETIFTIWLGIGLRYFRRLQRRHDFRLHGLQDPVPGSGGVADRSRHRVPDARASPRAAVGYRHGRSGRELRAAVFPFLPDGGADRAAGNLVPLQPDRSARAGRDRSGRRTRRSHRDHRTIGRGQVDIWSRSSWA